jgi:hypothetical protein
VEWTPLNLGDLATEGNSGSFDDKYWPKDLPSFVENLHWGVFKVQLPATIRMETPVLYFYASHKTSVSVQVKFAKGLITEWYPHAATPARYGGWDDALYRKHAADDNIFWNSVTVQPGVAANLPRDLADADNRYYAARETSSASLRVPAVGGDQYEKFLFYRGVSLFPVPMSAAFTPEGKLSVKNYFGQTIPNLIWFERRGDRVGYSIGNTLESGAEAVLESPVLTARLESLYGDLEETLVARGLYRDEAHAMVQTWRSSWFEEGSRVFYIVPASFVDTILPLTITPSPGQTVRVFVGRLEVISPATRQAVTAALASNDKATLEKYGRFLEPIRRAIEAEKTGSGRQGGGSAVAPCPVDPQQDAKRQR